jgi:glycosyltransferase involved in cell wall biosynthesis
VKAYRQEGILAEVVCLDRPGERFLEDVTCTVHALGESFLGKYSFSPCLWKLLHRNAVSYDAIVVNGIWSFIGVAARSAARYSRRPYGVFIHGALDPWFNKQYPLKRLKKRLYWRIQYTLLRDAWAVFFTTVTERDLASRSFRPNYWHDAVVPYGIGDPNHRQSQVVAPADEIEAFYRKFPRLRGRRYLLFLGRIHKKKAATCWCWPFESSPRESLKST